MLKLVASAIILVVFAWDLILVKDWVGQGEGLLSPTVDVVLGTAGGGVKVKLTTPTAESGELAEAVKRALAEAKGEYSFAVKNLRTEETYFRNDHRIYPSASLYKLWVMAIVYDQVASGKITLDDSLSLDVDQVNDRLGYEEGEAEVVGTTLQMTTKSALEQMITISHNYAAYMLVDHINDDVIPPFLEQNGFQESKWDRMPGTSAWDTLNFLEKLYRDELGTPKNSELMLETLKRQQKNEAIPKYLPEGVAVAHKTGEIAGFKHDAGIVFAPNGDYLFVAMSESDFPGGAAERIARVSEAVYEYFDK